MERKSGQERKSCAKPDGNPHGAKIPKLNDFDWVGFLGRSFMCTLGALVLETDGRGAGSAQARRAYLCCVFVALLMLPTWESLAHGQLFESDSKRFGNTKMDIKVREVERRERSSVIQVDIQSIGSSVGSSFFLLCSIRQLALQRGGFRHIIKIEEYPQRGQMLIGFLRAAGENPADLGPEFRKLGDREQAIDLEQFAEICASMK